MSITLDDLYTKIMAIEEKLDNLAKKVDEMGKSEHRYSSDDSTPGKTDACTSNALFQAMIKKFVECTSSRKKTVFVAQSNGSDAAKIDSYFKDPERLAASVQSFVSSIETGCAIDDIAAASQYLSALLNCTVTLESTEDNNDGAIFSNLATEPEASVQGKLRENWIMSPSHFDICVLDTHDSNFKAPIFKLSDKDAPDSGLLNTAKPDLTSLAAPMFLEIKDVSSTHGRRYSQGAVMMENEYDVLNQAINRIHVTD